MINVLFTEALGLLPPWLVERVAFDQSGARIDFHLGFGAARGDCPACQATSQPIHDRLERTWRHLNFFQYQAYLHAPVPRVACGTCGKTSQIAVPWADPRSGFTLLFEAWALTLAQCMPMLRVAKLLGVADQRLWQRLGRTVLAARDRESFAAVRHVTVDETARRRGHSYLTVVACPEEKRVLFATEGKDAMTLSDFASDLIEHGGQPAQITGIAMDFSAAFIKGAADHLPNAEVSFDPFHLIALASTAVDEVRRSEVKTEPSLRGQRYSLLKDESHLTVKQKGFVETLRISNLKSARAWRMKEALREIVAEKPCAQITEMKLDTLMNWLSRSRLEPMVRLGQTINRYYTGIVRAISQRRTNAYAESLNAIIQAAKTRARGFRTSENFIMMIYLIAGKLQYLPANPMKYAS